jgi:hypothetical protein
MFLDGDVWSVSRSNCFSSEERTYEPHWIGDDLQEHFAKRERRKQCKVIAKVEISHLAEEWCLLGCYAVWLL